MQTRRIVAAMIAMVLVGVAHAGFTKFDQDFAGWQSATGPFTTITFGEIPDGSAVTDQYAALGVLFTSWDLDSTGGPDTNVYPQDGFGLDGNCQIELTFTQPMRSIGYHYPGSFLSNYYLGDQLVYADNGIAGSGQADNFLGLIGDVTFDRVTIFGPFNPHGCDDVSLDNLYFSTVPAPGGAVMFVLAAMTGRRRRRA